MNIKNYIYSIGTNESCPG